MEEGSSIGMEPDGRSTGKNRVELEHMKALFLFFSLTQI